MSRFEQCLRSCGSEFQMWGPKQETVLLKREERQRPPLSFVVLYVHGNRMAYQGRGKNGIGNESQVHSSVHTALEL